jgi:hypothetical protein
MDWYGLGVRRTQARDGDETAVLVVAWSETCGDGAFDGALLLDCIATVKEDASENGLSTTLLPSFRENKNRRRT